MPRTYDSYNEVWLKAEHGATLRFFTFLEAAVSVVKQHGVYLATVTVSSPKTEAPVAIYERPFSSVDRLMEVFGMKDSDEIWEVLA